MISKQEFLTTYNMTNEDLEKARIEWGELERIAEEYEEIERLLRNIGKDFVE